MRRSSLSVAVLVSGLLCAASAQAKEHRPVSDFDPDSAATTEAEATAPELPDVPDYAPGEEPAQDAAEARAQDDASAAAAKPRTRSKPRSKRASRSERPPARVAAAAVQPAARADAAPVRVEYDLTTLAASPVPGVESSGFGWRDDPINNRRKFHKGTDFRAPRGTPVFAAGAGQVIFAGRMGGYGNVIFIDHGDGVVSRYGHLRKIGVRKNEVVDSGVAIGEVGATGRATGPHLHFEVRLDGRAVNPSVAMTVAALQRTNPTAAQAAAYALAPEVQETTVDPHRSGKRRGKRPERRGRAKRARALW